MDVRPLMLNESAIESRQRNRMEPWARKLVTLIFAKVEDARAHAENAVTQTLKNTPDGRATTGRVRQHRSYVAAVNRLDELWAVLAGENVQSISGMIHDATADFYEDSRAMWAQQIKEPFRVKDAEPSQKQITYARGLLWFGLPVRTGLEQVILAAKNGLLVACGQAGASDATKRDVAAALNSWELRHRVAIIKRAGLALNDANQRADLQAMRDTIKPEYQEF
jgi:hypothetical protein